MSTSQVQDTAAAADGARADRLEAERELKAAKEAHERANPDEAAKAFAEILRAEAKVRRATEAEAGAMRTHAEAERERKRRELAAAEQAAGVDQFKRALAAPLARLVELRSELVGTLHEIDSVVIQQATVASRARDLARELGQPCVARELTGAARVLALESLKDCPSPGASFDPWLTPIPRDEVRVHAIAQALRPGVTIPMPADRLLPMLLAELDVSAPLQLLADEMTPVRELAERERIAEEERRRELADAKDWEASEIAKREHAAKRALAPLEDAARRTQMIREREHLREQEDAIIRRWRESRGIVTPASPEASQPEAAQ